MREAIQLAYISGNWIASRIKTIESCTNICARNDEICTIFDHRYKAASYRGGILPSAETGVIVVKADD